MGRENLDHSLSFGVTTLEAKSGYGLETEAEMKMLRAIRTLDDTQPIRLKATFCGAHAVPREFKDNPDKYVDLVINEMVPKVAEKKLAAYVPQADREV